ncbi:glycosyltransferase family 8 protein, partial [Mycobacterium tuberculosis]
MSQIRRVFMSYEPSYWRGMVCTLGSLARNAQDPIEVEVLMRGDHATAFDRLMSKMPAYTHDVVAVRPLIMSKAALRECEVPQFTDHFKAEICFRLYYFEMSRLEGNALYVDIDTIVRASIRDISGALPLKNPLSARPHDHIDKSIKAIDPNISSYFNSGVMLFNCDEFGAEVFERMRESRNIMYQIHQSSGFLDQDALNLAFRDRWMPLPTRFNYMSSEQTPLDRDMGHILHATGSRKPWMLGGRHRF